MLFCADPDPSLCVIFTYLSAGCVGCWECQRDHRPCLDRQGWLKLESSFLFLLIFNTVACLCSDVMWCFSLDRTQLIRLPLITSWFNNLMEPLTSGVGANKRYYTSFLTRLVHLNHVQRRATLTSVRKSELIQVGGTTKGRGRTCELSRRNKRGHTDFR